MERIQPIGADPAAIVLAETNMSGLPFSGCRPITVSPTPSLQRVCQTRFPMVGALKGWFPALGGPEVRPAKGIFGRERKKLPTGRQNLLLGAAGPSAKKRT